MEIKKFIHDLEELFADKADKSVSDTQASGEQGDSDSPQADASKKSKDQESLFRRWGKLTTDFLKRVLLAPISFTLHWLQQELIEDLKHDSRSLFRVLILLVLFAFIFVFTYMLGIFILISFLWEYTSIGLTGSIAIGMLSQIISLFIISWLVKRVLRKLKTVKFIKKLSNNTKDLLPRQKAE